MAYCISICLFCVFALLVGLFFGCGNYGGLFGSIPPGLIAGAFVASRSLRTLDFDTASVLICSAVVGSIIAGLLSPENRLKNYARNQKGVTIRCFSYRLGAGNRRSN